MSTRLGFNFNNTGYNNINRSINQGELLLLRRTFNECDSNHKGFLTREDLKIAVITLFGYKPTKYEANKILEKYGENIESGDEKALGSNKFIEAMTPYMIKRDEDEEIRHTFLAFDAQCKGFLIFEDLQKVVHQVAPNLPCHVIETTFKELDRDGDKRVSYKDFDFMMKYGTEN
ncbi:EF-hand calcium-binding domain-containing protein 11 [Patella vulgata]|uniref:EF-hand calcium-binding domain-containing protein 11 n=1 Tax=Patella vulgata TaxID=6465 RepID=UPI0021806D69|nr:EF-hand calcium-binding domain-containing protein 11 [Patella vulgata]